MPRLLLTLLLAAFLVAPAAAAEPPPPDAVQDMTPVLVSGSVPGPGLWEVRAPDGHVLWVFGTLRPLPRRIEWAPAEARARLAESGVLLLAPGITIRSTAGFIRNLTLLPKLAGMRKDPAKAPLAEVLPPALYARWRPLKARYLPRKRKVERYRPFFAGLELYAAATRAAGLKDKDVAGRKLRKWAQKQHVPTASTMWHIEVDDPKEAIEQFRNERLDDTACFEQLLDTVEHRLPQMQELANAWSVGDIEVLAEHFREPEENACADAVSVADFARSRGFDDIVGKVRRAWIEAAEKALAEHDSSFAILPMSHILAPDGYLDALRARGYVIVPPGGRG